MMLFYAIMVAVSSTVMGASMMMADLNARKMRDAKKKLGNWEHTEEREDLLRFDYESGKRGLIVMILNSISCLLMACNFIIKLNI